MIWNKLKPILIGMAFLVGSAAMADDMKTKTYCIGRFLIDVPEVFDRIELGSLVRGGSFERIGAGTPEDAERMTRERVRTLKNGEVKGQSLPKIFGAFEYVDDIGIIEIWDDLSIFDMPPTEPWSNETYVHSHGVIYRVFNASDKETEAEKRESLIAIAKAIRPRAPDEIPAGPGLCASNDTYIDLPVGADAYSATITAPEIASLKFSILERGAEDKGYISDSGYKGRTRRTKIADMPGIEIQFRNNEGNEYGAIVSNLDAQGRNGAELRVELRIYDRSRLPGSIGTPDTLWDNVTNSLRRKD